MTISVHVTSHKHDVLVIRTFLLRYLEDKNWSYYNFNILMSKTYEIPYKVNSILTTYLNLLKRDDNEY